MTLHLHVCVVYVSHGGGEFSWRGNYVREKEDRRPANSKYRQRCKVCMPTKLSRETHLHCTQTLGIYHLKLTLSAMLSQISLLLCTHTHTHTRTQITIKSLIVMCARLCTRACVQEFTSTAALDRSNFCNHRISVQLLVFRNFSAQHAKFKFFTSQFFFPHFDLRDTRTTLANKIVTFGNWRNLRLARG